ncbi:hypothetical protein D9756_009593 [Leucocoprinus leucothites]|uniref:Acetyl-CoA synthetase-like protein n=1 Tax=Leucocoprinus leucothites TaxID=201217 RepID=A0A8H5CWS1_9AGAR|nr:hypothetical protein D9756_009593 [Leucoagaricus leucothites]
MPHLKSLWPNPPTVPDHLNVFETILQQPHHDEWPDFVLHVDEETGKTRTFREVRKKVNDLAAALGGPKAERGLGLRAESGEIIGIMSDNSSDYVVLVLALLKIAVPFALISCFSTPFELRHALKVTKTTRLFTTPQYLSRVLPVVQEAGIATSKILMMNGRLDGYETLDGLVARADRISSPHHKVRIVPKDSLAFLFFSSGTTGLPKAVMISHGNLLFAFRQAVMVAQDRATVVKTPAPPTPDGLPVVLAFLPMHHTFGFHIYSIRAFTLPTRFVIFRRWDTGRVLRAITRFKATSLSMVPSMWYQLVNHPEFANTDFSTIFAVHSGAAHLPKEISSKVLERTPSNNFFSEGYGMSETTVSAIVRPYPGTLNGRFRNVPGTTGVLLPGMEARIVRADGSEADFDEVGELWLRGDNIVSGYFDNPKATQDCFINGWLRTGDHFKVNRDHYFFFADRAKDTLKVSGSQVSPIEIETVLLAHPQKLVSDVTVAGVRGGGRTSDELLPRAWIVLSENGRRLGASHTKAELERWHQTNLSKYKWLRGGIEVVEEIPKSPTGKTLRRLLQDQHEQRVATKAKL